MRFSAPVLAAFVYAAGLTAAHPGHDLTEEIAERRAFLAATRRSTLAHCAEKLQARGVAARNVARRAAVLRRLNKRSLASDLATDHNQTSKGYTLDTPESEIFASNNSCVLTPEVTQGPYYVSGEFVRADITETQAGVPLTVDYQVIDVDTCEPVANHYVEMWHCNATGVYSGVTGEGGLNSTFLRGIQETDEDGVVQFQSIFPGHYTGRAPHIHILVHTNGTLLPNGTIGHDTTAMHVGQAFFDQTLISAVEQNTPYSTNTQELTANTDDSILAGEADTTEGVDPLMEYTLLGDSIEDGLFAWLAFGVNTSYAAAAGAAAYLYEDGGVTNANSDIGGGPSGGGNGTVPSFNGTAPSGAVPSGAAPSSSSTA